MKHNYTLVELIRNDHPSDDVLETFKDYAETGASISPESIKTIVDKTQLTPQELDAAYGYMQTGLINQIARGQGIAGLEYLQAMNYLAQMISGTMEAGEAMKARSEDSFVVLKFQLIKAHNHRYKGSLEEAVKIFQEYCITVNPNEFGEVANTIKLTDNSEYDPGEPGIYPKVYNLAKYGGSILVHNYLMGIHATDDLQIAEAPARK